MQEYVVIICNHQIYSFNSQKQPFNLSFPGCPVAEVVAALAAKHGRSASQILGRWWAPQKPRKNSDIRWMNVIYIYYKIIYIYKDIK